MKLFIFLIPFVLAQSSDDITKTHVRIYKRVSTAIVGIKSSTKMGSGVVISRDGVILTSSTAVGKSEKVDVFIKGHKKIKGRVIYTDANRELAFVRIDSENVSSYIQLGDSDKVKVGNLAYTLGDSNSSIITDDQVAMSVGVISGIYKLDNPKGGKFKGMVLETSAAVNPNQNGGALLDSKGRLIGMTTLTYHEARYAGLAIPINTFRNTLARVLFGVSLEESDDGVVISMVEKGTLAQKLKLEKGDLVKKINDMKIGTSSDFDKALLKTKSKFTLEIEREKERRKIDVDKGTDSY